MTIYSQRPLRLDKVSTYPLASRPSKVTVRDFAKVARPGAGVREWLSSLPQILAGESRVEIQYSRAVNWEGNPKAKAVMERVFVPCDASWRGLGVLPGSGLAIRPELARFDAEKALEIEAGEERENPACRCGEVLKGKLSPFDCPLFSTACTPESPVGACMVSSEGTCAAAYKYGR